MVHLFIKIVAGYCTVVPRFKAWFRPIYACPFLSPFTEPRPSGIRFVYDGLLPPDHSVRDIAIHQRLYFAMHSHEQHVVFVVNFPMTHQKPEWIHVLHQFEVQLVPAVQIPARWLLHPILSLAHKLG